MFTGKARQSVQNLLNLKLDYSRIILESKFFYIRFLCQEHFRKWSSGFILSLQTTFTRICEYFECFKCFHFNINCSQSNNIAKCSSFSVLIIIRYYSQGWCLQIALCKFFKTFILKESQTLKAKELFNNKGAKIIVLNSSIYLSVTANRISMVTRL